MTLTVTVCLLTSGCSGPTTVDAVPRKASNPPKFHAGEVASTRPQPTESIVNGADVSFLIKDHFGCWCLSQRLIYLDPDDDTISYGEDPRYIPH